MYKKLLLVDGSAVLHRAYHALPGLTDKDGRPTGGVYGFVRILLRTIRDLKPTHVAVVFDRQEPTFRKELYIAYQAQRKELDVELGEQFGRIRILLEAMNIPVYDRAGFEADDVIGSIAHQISQKSKVKSQNYGEKFTEKLRDKNRELSPQILKSRKRAIAVQDDNKPETEVIILTGDKDLMQLVNEQVKLYMPIKGVVESELIDIQMVKEKLGIPPKLVVDYKALSGDSSDNYPGVPGIGPKTALDLLTKFRSFESVYEHINEVTSSSVKAKLEAGRSAGELSKQLAAIKTDLEVEFDWTAAEGVIKEPGKLSRVLETFGFQSLVKQLGLEALSGGGQLSLV